MNRRKISFILFNVVVMVLLLLGLLLAFEVFHALALNLGLRTLVFWCVIIVGLLLENEFWQWVKKSKRSDTSDLLFILFAILLIYLITADFFTALLGALSAYLIISSYEMRNHEVVNKIVLISTITYNVMFVSGLVDFILDQLNLPAIDLLDKTFALALWMILILGFIFFGRKYIVVWRFMSPQYITMALYLFAWIFVATIGYFFPEDNFIQTWLIYPTLMVADVMMNVTSGFLIDKFLGVKNISKIDKDKASKIQALVDSAAKKLDIKGKIKVGYGDYPIINAMAYGPVFDKRICIISPEGIELPEGELEAIIAHELAHLKMNHPSKLLIISIADLVFRWCANIPATFYDFAFGKDFTIFGFNVGILGFLILNMAVFALLYIFIRVMEGNADHAVKKIGLGRNLAKALYNLESFYALGKQAGLNIMLLAEERLDDNHKIVNYMEAARILDKRLFFPPKMMAVGNLLNSHPPTSLRVANMLVSAENEYTSWQEAFLPGKFLLKKNAIAFSRRVQEARVMFNDVTREKFKELFEKNYGGNLKLFLKKINLHRNKDILLNNQVLAVHKHEEGVIHSQIIEVEYRDSITTPFVYKARKVNDIGEKEEIFDLIPNYHQFILINSGDSYELDGKTGYVLKEVQESEKLKDVKCILEGPENATCTVKASDLKQQVTKEFVQSLKGKNLFVEDKDAIQMFTIKEVKQGVFLKDAVLITSNQDSGEKKEFPLSRYRLKRERYGMRLHDDENYFPRYMKFFNWAKEADAWITLFLKKPVNNEYYCKITGIQEEKGAFTIEDNFGDVLDLKMKDLDFVTFQFDSLLLKSLEQESFIEKLAQKYKEYRKSVPWIHR
ncbi:MAG: M56 family metallopeptidase [Candidatus Hodarchaeota archaeon]